MGHESRPMSIYILILSVMLAITPSKLRPTTDSDRMETYKAIAQGISAAVDTPISVLPFDGPAAKEASALALAVIAFNESGYRQEVRDCRVKGDNERSATVFQLIRGPGRLTYTEKEICSDDALAARLSLNVLTWYMYTGTVKSIFQGYATGNAAIGSQGSKNQIDYFGWAVRQSKIRLVRKPETAKLWAESTEPVIASAVNDGSVQRSAALSP